MMIQETYYLKPAVIETVNILNGDFESWNGTTLNDWETSGTVTKTGGHTGSAVGLYRNVSISQTCKISGGHQYRLTAWLKAWIGTAYFDVFVDFDNGYGQHFNGQGDGTWTVSNWQFTVPDDAAEATFRFQGPYGQTYIDDVSCVLVQ